MSWVSDRRLRLRTRGNPVVLVAIILLLSWMGLETIVFFDFLGDRWSAYEGEVLAVESGSWIDRLSLEFTPLEHLIVRTDEGRILDKRVTVENRTFYRIEPGDRVVKERGFGSFVRVPGKPTVGELREASEAAGRVPSG